MSFQITVLKVLAGHPDGRASLTDLKRAVGILISSGTDWTDRTKRLAARAPGLDIFSQALVLRDTDGWQITDAGRTLLASIETRVPTTSRIEQSTEVIAEPAALPAQPPVRLVSTNRREPRRLARRVRISAVA
jgi:pimeloyl-ACP methyl ester carboxylesterase